MSDIKTWKRTKLFDGKGHTWLYAACKASDGYLIAGTDNHGGLFIKTDKTGEMQWIRHYSYSSHDELYCAKETEDGGYILAGMASGDGENDGLLVKTFSDGREDWHQVFTGKCNRLWGVDETEQGFIAVGSTTGNEFGYVIKTDFRGKKTGDATFGSAESLEKFNSIRRIKCGFLATGTSGAGGWSGRHGWAMKLDLSLNKVAERIYKGETPLFLSCSLPAPDGGYLLAGMINSNGYKACLLKVGKSLDKQWEVVFPGGNNELYPSIVEDRRGHYSLLTGNGSVNKTWISKISNAAERENGTSPILAE